MTETPSWWPTHSAPRLFPSELVAGFFLLPDGERARPPMRRVVASGWGTGAAVHIVGPHEKPLPTGLSLAWFSYVENRFYGGDFDLPAERIEAVWRAGATTAEGPGRPFEQLVAGTAPGGLVALWASGGGAVVELAVFEAAEIDLPWETIGGDGPMTRDALIDAVLDDEFDAADRKRIAAIREPGQLFRFYHHPRDWRLAIETDGAVSDLSVDCFNGERRWLDPAALAPPRFTPKTLQMGWDDGRRALRGTLTLDEAEIFAAFQRLSDGAPGEPLTLTLRTAEMRPMLSATLGNGREIYPLRHAAVRVWEAR